MISQAWFSLVLCGSSSVQTPTPTPTQPSVELKVLWMKPAPRKGCFGSSVARMNDSNGDGVADLLVANDREHFRRPGCAHFICARTGDVLSTFYEGKWRPPVNGEYFPSDVMNLGDLDGDGFDDAGLVVLTESFFYYRSYILSGSTRRIVERISGAGTGVAELSELVRFADIDGDGRGDWLAATRIGNEYVVQLRSGIEGGLLYSLVRASVTMCQAKPRVGERFEDEIVVVNDLNHDGAPDFAMVSPPRSGSTWVTIFSGRDGSIVSRLSGNERFDAEPKSVVTCVGRDLIAYSGSQGGGTLHALPLDGSCARVIASGEHLEAREASLRVLVVDDLDGDGARDLVAFRREYYDSRLTVISMASGELLYDDSPTFVVNDQFRDAYVDGLFAVGDIDGTQELALQVQDASVRHHDELVGYGLCVVRFERTTR